MLTGQCQSSIINWKQGEVQEKPCHPASSGKENSCLLAPGGYFLHLGMPPIRSREGLAFSRNVPSAMMSGSVPVPPSISHGLLTPSSTCYQQGIVSPSLALAHLLPALPVCQLTLACGLAAEKVAQAGTGVQRGIHWDVMWGTGCGDTQGNFP